MSPESLSGGVVREIEYEHAQMSYSDSSSNIHNIMMSHPWSQKAQKAEIHITVLLVLPTAANQASYVIQLKS